MNAQVRPSPPDNAAAFAPQADDVFARIAGRYDRLCDVFSLFAHRIWKERMAARIAAAPGDEVLDVASGTGDIPYRLLRRVGSPKRILVSDLCPEMLVLAREKLARLPGLSHMAFEPARALLPTWGEDGPERSGGPDGARPADASRFGEGGGPPTPGPSPRGGGKARVPSEVALASGDSATARPPVERDTVSFARLDAHDLAEVPSDSVDIYSISFAMKICDRHRVVAEAFRVLRPGGLFLCLEAGHIPLLWVQAAYLAYMERCIPAMGWIATRDPSSYGYLLRGIRDFPDQRAFVRELGEAGFADVAFENMTFGIVALHRAVKPQDAITLPPSAPS